MHLRNALALLGMATLTLGAMAPAHASDPFLWYNGNFDGANGNYSLVGGNIGTGFAYDDFIVPAGETWSVTGLFAHVFVTMPTFSQAQWEIRSGVSTNNGGTLVASGTDAATLTSAGSGFGANLFLTEVNASALLSAGTYWLGIAPVAGSSADSGGVVTTSGAGAVGMPAGNNFNAFLNILNTNTNFLPILNGASSNDLSYGVRGVLANPNAVPEPGSLALLGVLSLTGGAWLLRRKRFRK